MKQTQSAKTSPKAVKKCYTCLGEPSREPLPPCMACFMVHANPAAAQAISRPELSPRAFGLQCP